MATLGRLPRIRSAIAMVLLAAVAAGCSVLPVASTSSSSQTARDAVVADYLGALERRDAAAIAAMVSPRVDASADIAQVLARYGGMRLHGVQAMWLDEFEGSYVVATVTATGQDGTAYEIRVPMSWSDGRYYLALGQATPSGSEANPESPTP
jgi:hypothetical protein